MADQPNPASNIPELPADATPEQKDAHWFKYVYRGDQMPQLTVRAVVMGGFLGMLMAAANLYTTLSIGWAFGIAITACVLSFVIWNFVRFCSGNKLSQMTILENACMASTASAAGYSTGSTIATMFGAMVLLKDVPEGVRPSDMKTIDITLPWVVTIFTLCTGLMGVFLAIPMKRQMINHERLPFPSGTAAAETLTALYSASKEAIRKAYVLVAALAAGLLIGFLRAPQDVLDSVPFLKRLFTKLIRIPGEIEMHFLDRLYSRGFHPGGFAFEPSALLIAAGMIVGMRISLSLAASSFLLYAVVGPQVVPSDANVLAGLSIAVVDAVKAAGASRTETGTESPESLRPMIDALVGAAEQAARDTGLDPAPIGKAARGGAQGALEDAAKKKLSGQETLDLIIHDAADGGAGAAMNAAADRPGKVAAEAAREKALASGATASEADTVATAAYETNKHRRQFIWSWADNTVTTWRWSLWGGTAVMVFASLTSVALQWRTLGRAFGGARRKGGQSGNGDSMSDIEVPGKWMVYGMIPITIAMVWLQVQAFEVEWWAGIIAVAMSFVLSMVASRATGETDTTPVGAMGKVMQLLFAVLAPKNIAANLASAGIAANSASASADLLTDLKTGYLLGAHPRRQFLAQFFGVFFGTIAIVPIWYLMVPTREKLETFAMPGTRSWEAVARVLVKGIAELPDSAKWLILIGALVGTVLPIIERLLPAKARQYMPSATGIGLAWVMPFQNAFSFFVGAVIAMLWGKMHVKSRDHYNIPAASGLIAGESLMQAAMAITATVVGLLAAGAASP